MLTMGQILHTRGLCWTERIREWSCIRGGAQCTFRCSRHTRTAKLWKTWTELAPCPKTSEDSKVGCNFPRTSQEHNSQQIQYPIRRRDRNCAARRVLGRAIKTTRFGLCAQPRAAKGTQQRARSFINNRSHTFRTIATSIPPRAIHNRLHRCVRPPGFPTTTSGTLEEEGIVRWPTTCSSYLRVCVQPIGTIVDPRLSERTTGSRRGRTAAPSRSVLGRCPRYTAARKARTKWRRWYYILRE
jgi:hypothetical protein